MPDKSPPDDASYDSDTLDHLSGVLQQGLSEGDVPDDRRMFLEALMSLQQGDVETASKGFRRATRKSGPPFGALAAVARAECDRLRGRIGSAIRNWRKVAEDEDTPEAVRYMAWLSLAAVAADRENGRLLEQARDAIRELEASGEF